MTDEKFLARQGRRADEVVATRPSPVSPASRHRGAGGTGAGGIERDLPEIDHSTDGAYWGSIARAVANLERQAEGDRGCLLLVTLSSDHPEWPVRAAAVRLLAEHHREQTIALRAIAAAVCDDVDQVAFTAIELAGRHRIRAAVANLIKISGWPSRFTQPGYARKPVGYGAALTDRKSVV